VQKIKVTEIDSNDIRERQAHLEQIVEDLVERSFGPCRQALADSGLDASQIDEVVLVGGQTRMPLIQKRVQEFFGKEPHRGVNPDEVVAIGAAIQGGVLRGDVKDMLLLDVTPLSLGIETLGGVMTKLIERNTTIPTRKSEVFSTAADNQTQVEVHVLQGERQMAKDNRTLGRFHLVGIPPAPRGMPQVEVTFDIDANGIVNVSAKDRGTGKQQAITITSSSGLDDGEIDRMVKDAESHASEDQERRKKIDARNQLDSLVYTTEKSLKEHGDKLAASDKTQLEKSLEDAKKALEGDSLSEIEGASERLMQASHKLAEVLYKNAGGPEGGPESGPSGGDAGGASAETKTEDEDVIDAEYVDVGKND